MAKSKYHSSLGRIRSAAVLVLSAREHVALRALAEELGTNPSWIANKYLFGPTLVRRILAAEESRPHPDHSHRASCDD